ncbi:STAS domain-containing protein [Microbacterium sp. cx-55]|uniref:SulP family inorganic anion transporter n=1 Tax=Microbacterium sp. cx-55 TaxID=2875948 RepID=UPI001CC141A9|nr:SulP family inorganic anion transporter [Microbacterium sp. cx-55]MBZ4486815.1 STAS domain-containing protein [Microbacterium sp. cx-55]UGB35745.1 STAS domain-containing protein [Microbacterium sp. cx-55]
MRVLIPGLNRHNVAGELLAGVTLVAIAIPLNIGYAQIAGLPASAGLYALVVPALVWALLASSRQLVVSSDAASASLVASSLGGLAVAGSQSYAVMALAQAVICGVVFLLMAVFRLGFLATFLSKPILVGFVGGLSLDILVSQVAKALGVHVDSGAEFTAKVVALATGLADANPWSMLIAGSAAAILLIGQRLFRAVPWALVVMVAATSAVALTHADAAGVQVLGAVPAGPPDLTWPVLDAAQWLVLVPSALALAMVASAEGLLVSRSYGEKHQYATRPNRDLFAFGVASIAAGASGSFALGASTSRTAAMDRAGSRTQLPSLVLAGGTLLLLLFGTDLLAEIPAPAIGAIVGVAILPLLGFRELRRLWRLSRFEFWIAVVCFVVTLTVGSIAGIVVAFVLALINLARRAATPTIDVLADDGNPAHALVEGTTAGQTTAAGTIIIRMAAPLFFANGAVFTQAVKSAITDAGGPDDVLRLVVDMEAVTDVDVTGADEFDGLRTWLAAARIELEFSRVRSNARARLARFGVVRAGDTVFSTNRAAASASLASSEGN